MKNLYFIVTVILIVCSLQPVKAVNVSGSISTDSIWDISGSPYVISSSLTIEHGATLTIQPGVQVLVNDYQNLYLYGTLVANGVTFGSSSETPEAGSWGGIYVGSNYYTSDSGKLSLTDCEVQHAQLLEVDNGITNLSNTNLSNFLYEAVRISGSNSTLNITGGNITGSSYAASYYSAISTNSLAKVVLSGVNIQNFQYGLYLRNKAKVEINTIGISSCNWPIYYESPASLKVTGNNIFNNHNNAVLMNMYSISDTLILPTINIPYYFPSGLTVNQNVRLEIGSNNILKFGNWTSLNIYGSLYANAAENESIYFTSYYDDNWGGDTNNDGTASAPSFGNWYGIQFQNESDDAGSLLNRCNIRFAGAGNIGGISTYNASPTVSNCDISNNYIGIYMQYASNPVLNNNTIGSSKLTPLAMSFEANPLMSNNILSFSDNEYDAIGLIGGTLSADAVLKTRSVTNVDNITYLMLDQIVVPQGKTLTINKGIVIKSYSYSHRIIVSGTLIANATADSMISFTSAKDDNYGNPGDCNKDGTITSPTVGDWGGIIFTPGATGLLNYCRFKYATNWYYGFSTCSTTEYINDAAIGLIDASPTISNCEFKDLYYGISCYRASNPTLTSNSMVNILFTPICLSSTSNPTFSGITFTNVGWRAIGLLGGNVCQNGTIKKRDLADFTNISYVMLADITINSGAYVNIEPGVVIKNAYGSYGNRWFYGRSIYVDGGFRIDGTENQPVVFTSIKDDNEGNPGDSNGDGNSSTPSNGDWGSIKFLSTNDDAYSFINYARIKYAGSANEGAITYENAGGMLKHTLISNSSSYGLYCNGNSNPVIDSVTIENSSLDPIAMSLTSTPSLTNISFNSNYSQAIKIIEGTLSTNATIISRNIAGITNIAYIISNLTISSNARLTISPGVVIKFRYENYCQSPSIAVYGNLIAQGTPENHIYFTSFADDSKGGDSNNNGNNSIPEKGDWGGTNCWDYLYGGIKFMDNSTVSDTVNHLTYCEISYAATGTYLQGSHATFDNCVFQQSNIMGASVIGSSNPLFRNCSFYNINYTPVELSMFSNPTFESCNALNVGYMALAVVPETYSQNDTVPIRSFGGYDNISYFMKGQCTINTGTTITIPAGVVFKSHSGYYNNFNTYNYANGFIVNGTLKVLGTPQNPVVFTNAHDDTYGNPKDMNQNGSATAPPDGSYYNNWYGNWITFNDVSNDSSIIQNTIFKYADRAITATSASPTLNGITFEHNYYGVDMSGVSQPKIDNCQFNNLLYYPMQISLVAYPASSANNLISGSTYKAIKVRDETLTQDVTLPKRSFGGIQNIPYYFENYVVGTSATLTINPGVICKFKSKNYWESPGLSVYKGFIAKGGNSIDSTIVFTCITDDFYGGDTNSDSSQTAPYPGCFNGIVFGNEALDPLCTLSNCVIRYAHKGIETVGASPTITNCNFNNNEYAVYANAASNPVFSNCDFNNNSYFSINNVDKSFTIEAPNCWWGSNNGPIQSDNQSDGSTEQETVSTYVNYSPWKTTGSIKPLAGDVSLNGNVSAYDASLVLMNVVSLASFNETQAMVADVSGTTGITAYDASLILQYVVGLVQVFPVEIYAKTAFAAAQPSMLLSTDNVTANSGSEITVPVYLSNVSNIFGLQTSLSYNSDLLTVKSIKFTDYLLKMNVASNFETPGTIQLAVAGTTPLQTDGILANIVFKVTDNIEGTVNTQLTVNQIIANETNVSSNANLGIMALTGDVTNINLNTNNLAKVSIYPNPFSEYTNVNFTVAQNNSNVNIYVTNANGTKVATIVNKLHNAGTYTLQWNGTDNENNPLPSGFYFIRIEMNDKVLTQKISIIR
jgi:parallel beta-helix repeat protein